MRHKIIGSVRKRQLFTNLVATTALAMAASLAMPGLAQDDRVGNTTPVPPEGPTGTAGATVPRLVTFSGVLKDASEKPVTGTVTLAFSVYEFQEGGSPLWVETQAVQADAQGRYAVLLGATQPDGVPLDLFTTGRARWLGIQPQLPAAGEQPRVLLAGVPYALKAGDADTLGGKPASAYVTTETLGAPDGALPASVAPASAGAQTLSLPPATGQARRKASSTGPLNTSCSNVTADGTAKANFVAKFISACVIHQSAIFESSGKVGIGNTSPGGALDVSGTTVLRNTLNLSQTTGSSVGVINMGSSPFIHACCSSSAGNTFVGGNAGNFTTTGNGLNTAIGFKALSANSTGFRNTATGNGALQSDTIGAENTAFGYFALNRNTNGDSNTAVGDSALTFDTSGFNNTAIGFSAMLSNGTGTDNTAMGDSALSFNTTGSFNTAIGESTLGANTTGKFNTALGTGASVSSGSLFNATAIGAEATVGESNAIVLGCASTSSCQAGGLNPGAVPPNVGIGTATPTHRLESAADANAGFNSTWPIALVSQTTPSKMLGMGFDPGLNAGFIQATQTFVGSNALLINPDGGNVGIGTTGPDSLLTVNGSADKPGGGSWGTFSDGRLKTVAGTYDAGLNAILNLTPVRYRYKEQNAMGIRDGQEHIGFVAQEVEKVIPEAVSRNNRGYLLVNNDPILWTMLNAIKQQQAEIEALTRAVHQKDAQIQKLTEQAQALQKLQHRMVVLEGRLGQVEVKSGDSLALVAIAERDR